MHHLVELDKFHLGLRADVGQDVVGEAAGVADHLPIEVVHVAHAVVVTTERVEGVCRGLRFGDPRVVHRKRARRHTGLERNQILLGERLDAGGLNERRLGATGGRVGKRAGNERRDHRGGSMDRTHKRKGHERRTSSTTQHG